MTVRTKRAPTSGVSKVPNTDNWEDSIHCREPNTGRIYRATDMCMGTRQNATRAASCDLRVFEIVCVGRSSLCPKIFQQGMHRMEVSVAAQGIGSFRLRNGRNNLV